LSSASSLAGERGDLALMHFRLDMALIERRASI
jgi:hypothetical protein